MKKPVPFTLVGTLTVLALAGFSFPGGKTASCPPVVLAQADWKAEFDSVCSKTDVAMTLSVEELRERIARCDKLKTLVEGEEESTRKVYLRRLRMCRDLYQYVLESKETN